MAVRFDFPSSPAWPQAAHRHAFAAHFWINLTPNVSSPLVLSEIRFVVGEEFVKAGISIAFPQRDVHIDASRPIKVEGVSAASDSATL